MEKTPKVSVIIPSLDGYRDGNVEKLLADLQEQTIKDCEVKVIKGVRPNGKARNVGVQYAKGQIVVFIDDDVRLGHNKVLENLIKPLESEETMAMTGASVKQCEDAGYLAKEYGKIATFVRPTKNTIDYEGFVQHSCLAIKRSIYEEIGGESDGLITGTDVDLNMRIKARGYRVAIIPHTWVYHLMPDTVLKLIKKVFEWGVGLAYADKIRPEVFGFPKIKFTNYTIKTKSGALLYRIMTSLMRLPVYLLILRPVFFLYYFFNTAGYIYGWITLKKT